MLNDYPNGKCIYITINNGLVNKQYLEWKNEFPNVCKLENGYNNILSNVKLINKSKINK